MDALPDFLSTPAAGWMLAVLALKATLLVALGLGVVVLMRRESAARRHLALALALGALVALPLLELALPAWNLGWASQASPLVPPAPPAPPCLPRRLHPRRPRPHRRSRLAAAPPAPPAPPVFTSETGAADVPDMPDVPDVADIPDVPDVADIPDVATIAETRAGLPTGLAGSLALVWLAGSVVTALYVAAGRMRVARWGWTAPLVDDDRLVALTARLARDLGIRRAVRLVWLDAATPMTWGVRHPVVSLPRVATDWDDERQRLVLLHELTHVARLDALAQTASQAACVLFWWHPLVWLAARRLTHERECACDDAVLARGARASSYAQHLLDIARALRASVAGRPSTVLLPATALAMARRSELDGRLRAILTSGRRRDSLTRMHASATATIALALALPFAAAKPWGASGDAPAALSSDIAVSDLPDATGDDFTRTFTVRPGGTLTVETDAGSIEVEAWNRDAVEVRAENTFGDRFRIGASESGGGVRVEGRWADRRASRNWGRNERIRFVVRVPARFSAALNTAGGSISISDLTGDATLNTSGGSLSMGDIRGSVDARTSGGSVSLASASGNATLRTSGGSVSSGRVGGRLVLNTSGGSISLDGGADKGVDARTSGGSIRASFDRTPTSEVRLSTSGGGIRVDLPGTASMDLDASTSAGRVRSDFHSGTPRATLRTPIGRGGPMLYLRTSAGNIEISSTRSGAADTGARTGAAPTWNADASRVAANDAAYGAFATAERIRALEASQAAVRRHRDGAPSSAEIARLTRDAQRLADDALRGVDVERITREAMQGVDVEKITREAMRGIDVEAITRDAMNEARRALSDPSVKADLARARRETDRAVREAQREVEQAVREAEQERIEAQRERDQDRVEAQREAAQERADALREAAQDRAEAQREAEQARREAARAKARRGGN